MKLPRTFDEEWQTACQTHVHASNQVSSAQHGSPAARKALRSWWDSVAVLLHMYTRTSNWPNGQDAPPLHHLPWPLMHILAEEAFHLANGTVTDLTSGVMAKGAPPPGPQETMDRGIAVRYVREAKAGRVADSTPVKTVSEAFGVTRRTVQDWVKWLSDCDEPAAFVKAENLTEALGAAGIRYQRAGRSHKAIRQRNSKCEEKSSDSPHISKEQK
jgi:hypothetical protein